MRKVLYIFPLASLLIGACSSASGYRRVAHSLPTPSEVAKALSLDQESPGELRLWVDTSLLFPYRAFALDLDSRPSRVKSFLWWPYEDAKMRRLARKHMRAACPATLMRGSNVVACEVATQAELTGEAISLASQIRDILAPLAPPRKFGPPTEGPDGVITGVMDGTYVEVQVYPFDAEASATVAQPESEYCQDPICGLVATLIRELDDANRKGQAPNTGLATDGWRRR